MKTLLVVLLISVPAFAAQTEVVIGKIYPIGSAGKGEPLYVQRTEVELDGNNFKMKATIKDPEQKVVMTETAVFKDGQLTEQDVEQLQINERYELRVKEGRVTFRTFKKNASGEEKLAEEKSEKSTSDFLTGPGFTPFLRAQQKPLADGKTVSAQFGVFELARSVRFEFKRIGRAPAGENFKIRMEPASFWLSMLVSPIDMEVDPKTMMIVHYLGRTPLRTKVNKDWKPLDAEIIYTAGIKP